MEPKLYPIYPPPPPVAIRIDARNVEVSGFTVSGIDQAYEPIRLLADGAQIEDNFFEYSNVVRVWSNNNTITRSNVSNIKLTGSYNKILLNTLTGNASIDGAIHLKGSHNIIFSNIINDVAVYGFYSGINIDGDNNIVAKNNLTRSSAIKIETGSNNVILGNKLLNSGGLHILSGSNNALFANQVENASVGAIVGSAARSPLNTTLYHNNFINNTKQVTSYGGSSSSQFDNGKEGNYWSDYAGVDANGDGIGDKQYIVDSNQQDRYPLMAPFNISSVTFELPEWGSPSKSSSPSPSIEPDSASSPFITALVLALVITVTVEGIGLLIYYKKRKR